MKVSKRIKNLENELKHTLEDNKYLQKKIDKNNKKLEKIRSELFEGMKIKGFCVRRKTSKSKSNPSKLWYARNTSGGKRIDIQLQREPERAKEKIEEFLKKNKENT